MTYEEMLKQLESLRDNSADMAKSECADDIWARDVEALEMALDILRKQEGRIVVLPCKVGDAVYKICPISTFLEIGDRWDGRIVQTDCQRCAYYACDCHDIGYQKDARNVIVERKMSTAEQIIRCMPYFGTIYFLTREEAERALEGGTGE